MKFLSLCRIPGAAAARNSSSKVSQRKLILVGLERCTEIERQNRMLLEKMNNIIRSNSSSKIVRHAAQQSAISVPPPPKRNRNNNKSLRGISMPSRLPKHKPRHEAELEKIARDNIAILKHL
jgi:hypothetical protein